MSYFNERRSRMKIGASEIPAAIGEGHYQTPRELAASWHEPDDREQTDAMRMGQLIEEPIVTMLEERGFNVRSWPQDEHASNPAYPSIEITPDAITADAAGQPNGVVECNCLRAYHEDAIADAVAGRFRGAMRQYAIQALAQAEILQVDSATLAVWCDGTLYVIPVEADDLPSGREICEQAEAFMARLAAGEEQPIHRRDEWARPQGEEDETDDAGLVEKYIEAMTPEQRITELEDALIAMARALRSAQKGGYIEPGPAKRSYETAAAVERLAIAAEKIAKSRTTPLE